MGFGTAVRSKRRDLGWTLEQLSERTNVTPNYLGRVETEKVDPSMSIALAIAQALRTPIGELTGDAGSAKIGARKTARPSRADSRELAAIFEQLPLDVQETLLPALRAIADRIGGKRRAR
jgi:transcriptional regulator with XRE-family HTH domain